jgi:hypothetical protein
MTQSTDYLKVENSSGLVRDKRSKAILVSDLKSYEDFKRKRAKEKHLLSIEEKLNKVLKLLGEDVVI